MWISMISAVDREIRLGIWKIHILHHAASRPVWGRWLLEELAEHGHVLSPGTLYPALLRMEVNGWLERTGDAAHARARQSFRITAAGRQLLEALRREVHELHQEVVLGRASRHPPDAPRPAAPRPPRPRGRPAPAPSARKRRP
ncbi:MAG: helix-turn-helix transcriptional regulator [Deltaproteobacteria bacterium]|nr:helix-turn-helix transcriptional regulator [Deltaproteobacteria bacterium]